jgi:hypothetical protein
MEIIIESLSSGGDSKQEQSKMQLYEEIAAFFHSLFWLRARLLERKLTQAQCYRRMFWQFDDKHGPFVAVRMPGRPRKKYVILRTFGSPGEAQQYMNRRMYGADWQEQLKYWRGEYATASQIASLTKKNTFKVQDYDSSTHAEVHVLCNQLTVQLGLLNRDASQQFSHLVGLDARRRTDEHWPFAERISRLVHCVWHGCGVRLRLIAGTPTRLACSVLVIALS